MVGGFYGPGSFAGYSEHAQNLLISQRWELDEEGQWFTKPATDSVGLWLPRDSVVSIEAYAAPEDEEPAVTTLPPVVRVNIR